MHSLYLRNTSMAAKSASEKQGGVGVKAPHLTVICPFPWQCNLVWYSLYLLLCCPAQLSAPISPHSQAPSLHCLLTISPNFSPCFFPCLPSPMYGMLRVLREHLSARFSFSQSSILLRLFFSAPVGTSQLGLFILISQIFLMSVSFFSQQ